jgi:hypothetical protein
MSQNTIFSQGLLIRYGQSPMGVKGETRINTRVEDRKQINKKDGDPLQRVDI